MPIIRAFESNDHQLMVLEVLYLMLTILPINFVGYFGADNEKDNNI